MSWTKRQFITQAFEEIGLAAYVFDLTPEQLDSALRRMDAMVAGWNAVGVRLNYPLPSSPEDSDLDQPSGVPDAANEAIYLNLAVRLGPSMGKAVAVETKVAADMAYNSLVNQTAVPMLERQLPATMPLGQGPKPWRTYGNPFVNPPRPTLDAGPDGPIEFR